MPVKPSGEVRTSVVKVTQKNGDIYLMERQTVYDPEKKYNRILSSKLVAKIPKGEETPVPTRPKRPNGSKNEAKSKKLTASRVHVGMMDIIEHIGEASGIDGAVYAFTDAGRAQKIISSQLPGICWQQTDKRCLASKHGNSTILCLIDSVSRKTCIMTCL